MHVEVEVVELHTHPVTAGIRADRHQRPSPIFGYDVVLMGWNDGLGLSPDSEPREYQRSGHDRKGQCKLDLHVCPPPLLIAAHRLTFKRRKQQRQAPLGRVGNGGSAEYPQVIGRRRILYWLAVMVAVL